MFVCMSRVSFSAFIFRRLLKCGLLKNNKMKLMRGSHASLAMGGLASKIKQCS